jgi:uncharacterized Zn-finger protein
VRKEGYAYRLECDVCDYGTDHSSHMKKHEEKHADVRYHCPVCHKGFRRTGTLKTHREAVHDYVRHECPVTECDKSYTRKSACTDHIRLEHGSKSSLVPIRRTIEEQIEASKSRNQSAISSSASSSSRGGMGFVRKEGYEYRLECDVCDYGTDHSNHMKRHEDVHAGVRYHCPKCTHQSTTRRHLQIHISTVHDKRRDFECPECHKGFGQAGHLKQHRESVHEGVRHECPVAECDKSYTMKGNCVIHIRLDHGGDSSLVPIRRSLEGQMDALLE